MRIFKNNLKILNCNSIEELKEAAKYLNNFNGNTISCFLKQQIEVKKFVENIFNNNKKKYCTLNKTFIALVKDIEFRHCKVCGKELTYDQTWNHADFCSNKCKLSSTVNPFTREDVKEKIKQTNFKRYGVENPMQCEEVKAKVKATTEERYGKENVFQREDIKQKIRETTKLHLGVEHSLQNFKSLQKFKVSRKKTAFENFKNICKEHGYTLLCDIEHYKGVHNVYQLKCNKCGNIFNARYHAGGITTRCFVCEPRKFPPIRSKKEIEVCDYICSVYNGTVDPNNREVIALQEIDIYLPDLHIGFEFDGGYWHSLKPAGYHEHKDELGLKAGVKIYHIAEEDWDNNKQEVKNFIYSLIF